MAAVNRPRLAPVVNVQTWGLVGDGVTDDGPAFRRMLAAVGSGAAIQFNAKTYRFVMTTANPAFTIPAQTAIAGAGRGLTTFKVDTDGAATDYREFMRNGGDGCAIQDVTIQRNADFTVVLFPIQSYRGWRMTRCEIVGQRDLYTNYCHAIQFGVQNAGITKRVLLEDSRITTCSFGAFMANASTATIKGVTVRDCEFANNYASDLELNAPNGTFSNVKVLNTEHADNQATGPGAGFAVGLAHITNVLIDGIMVENYNNEAIHIEDYSSRVKVTDAHLTSCGLLQGSYIQIISGAERVTIRDFDIDATANATAITAINCLAGGTGVTPGGRTVIPPESLDISRNRVKAGANVHGVYLEAVTRARVLDNSLLGSGTVTAGVYAGSLKNGIHLYDGKYVVCTGNLITGFFQAFPIRTDTVSAFGHGSVVSNNVIAECSVGIGAINPGETVIAGNMIHSCVRPFVLGQGEGHSYPALAVANHAYNCTEGMEIYGSTTVTASGNGASVTVGTGKTLNVAALRFSIPSGTVLTFSGGGTLTLTSKGAIGATSLAGTVATASIANAQTATVTLAHSVTTADNMREIIGNGDWFQGASGYPYKTRVNGDWSAT